MKQILAAFCCILMAALSGNAAGRSVVVDTRAAGELEARLSDQLLTVEELTVRGPVNEADFKTMKRISICGRLKNLNLTDARVDGKKIPDYAFAEDREPRLRFPVLLRRVRLPNDVEELGEKAFYGASLLEEVILPKSLKRIGNSSFNSCSSLTLTTNGIPDGVTEIGNEAFLKCGSLKELIFPLSIKKIGRNAFNESGLELVSFPDGCEAEIGENAFMSCQRLREVDLPNSIAWISASAFSDDRNLVKLNLPKCGGYVAAEVAYQNQSLKEVHIPETVTYIGQDAFGFCRSLESVELPEGLEEILFGAFIDCRRVENLILPSTLKNVWYSSLSFPGLKRMYCKSAVPPEFIGLPGEVPFGGFDSSGELDTPDEIPVYVPVGSSALYRNAPGWDYFKNYIETSEFPDKTSDLECDDVIEYRCVVMSRAGELASLLGDGLRLIKSLKVEGPVNASDFEALCDASFYGRLEELDLSDSDIEGRHIPAKAFVHPRAYIGFFRPVWLRRVVLPDNIESIGSYAFYNAVFLQEINIPNSLRRIDKVAFGLCENLETPLSLPEGIEEIPEKCFYKCAKIREAHLPSSLKTIGDNAFGYSGIKTINLPDGLTAIGSNAFIGCELREIEIPNSITEWGESVFASNIHLQTLRMPEGLNTIPTKLALNCMSLNEIAIPASVETVMFAAFSGCGSLETVDLPAQLGSIGERAFGGCGRLNELRLPEQSLKLEPICLSELCGLERLYSKSVVPPVCAFYNLKGTNLGPFDTLDSFKQIVITEYDTPRDIPVYVPRGSAEAYRSAPGWDYFTNFIETDEFPDASVGEVAVPGSNVEVRVEAGRVILAGSGEAFHDYAVYTVDGRVVASGRVSGEAAVSAAPGLYIVRCGSRTAKVAVP